MNNIITKAWSIKDKQNLRSLLLHYKSAGVIFIDDVVSHIDIAVSEYKKTVDNMKPFKDAGNCPKCKSAETRIVTINDEQIDVFECNNCWYSFIIEE